MEVLEGQEKMLSNYEVLKILRNVKESSKNTKLGNKNLATITYETINYLESLKHYNELRDEHVIDYLEEMKRFNLTKLEKLQILNQRPKSMVELQVLIEENEERFSEEAMDMMLDIVRKTLPAKEEEVNVKMEVYEGEDSD